MTARFGAPIVPSSNEPIGMAGNVPVLVSQTWQRFFNNLVGSPQPITPVALTGSPFAFEASGSGHLAVSGGTVSTTSLKRAKVTIAVSGSNIPVMNGDVVTLTYSAAPTLNFIPS